MKETHLDDEIMPFGSLDKTGLGWNCFEFERRCPMDSVYAKALQCAWGENTVIAPRELQAIDGKLDWGYLANAD